MYKKFIGMMRLQFLVLVFVNSGLLLEMYRLQASYEDVNSALRHLYKVFDANTKRQIELELRLERAETCETYAKRH